MSLLMDALKKAELAKRQGQGDGVGGSMEAEAPGELALQPIDNSGLIDPAASIPAGEDKPSATNLPHLEADLEALDARFLAEAQQAASVRLKSSPPPVSPVLQPAAADTSPRTTADADTASRHVAAAEPRRTQAPEKATAPDKSAAKNLFAAKQPEKPPARKSFAIAVGVITVLSVSGIGGYFWWQLQPKTAFVANRAPPPTAPASISAPAAVSPAPTLAAAPAAPIAAAPGTARPATPMPDDDKDDSAPVAAKAPAKPRRTAAAPAAPTETDSPVRVTKAPLQVNPALIRGFDAFNRGELAMAQLEYERAQKSDPRNTDALHGLAAIAVRQGRFDQAELLYRRIAEADPQDTVAMSALISSRAQIDPGAAESRLKSLSAAQPELAAPHFSLGNLYSRYGRWSEAQQAYFRAYSAEPDNPDILYNLAISFEHLRQNKLAAQYYNQALAAAQNRAAGFDKAQATARLRILQP
ncbi:MAG: tetratricopeptide repeat protein [Sulfuritalea sp.]|nr:tetratricopeptide repeat protein [Sulfuritalea sp.]